MLVACRLAGLSALGGHYADDNNQAQLRVLSERFLRGSVADTNPTLHGHADGIRLPETTKLGRPCHHVPQKGARSMSPANHSQAHPISSSPTLAYPSKRVSEKALSGPFVVWRKSGMRTPDAMPTTSRRCRHRPRTGPRSDCAYTSMCKLTIRSNEPPLSSQAGAPLRAQETSSRAATSLWADD
jgi:hypothetical protein